MIRNLISKFNRSISERRVPARKQISAPVRIWFAPEIDSELDDSMSKSVGISGETVDISRTGIAFVVSSIRLKEKYLVGQDRKLNVEVDLPSGKLNLQIVGRRYKQVGTQPSSGKFLVGAQILRVDGDSNAVFDRFLLGGVSLPTVATPGLELGMK